MKDDTQRTVLIIDDDQDMRWAIRNILAETGFQILEANGGGVGLEIATRRRLDAVLLDLNMPGISGDEVLRLLQRLDEGLPVIMVTGHGTIPGAIDAIRSGVFEYIVKPFRNEWLLDVVRRAVSPNFSSSGRSRTAIRAAITSEMGHSDAIHTLVDRIEPVAACDYSVLIRGETGAGKEVVARCLHANGTRATKPLVVVDCGNVVESLTGSDFFGHERGTFTGATSRRHGWFEAANGGTLFLDEVGNLSAGGQQALLRALEDRVIHRLGSTAPIRVDLRVIAATNEAIEDGKAARFREDLYFRLAEYVISIPPLRARREDVEFLADRFLDEARTSLGRSPTRLAPAALDLLRNYSWPGNVRELRSVVRRAALVAGAVVTGAHIAACMTGRNPQASLLPQPELPPMPLPRRILGKVIEIERHAVIEALQQADGNKSKAARLLGIDYKTYRMKLKAFTESTQGSAVNA